MKGINKIAVLALLFTMDIFAQAPAQTIPAFTFKKLNKITFTNKDLEPGKLLFFVFYDADCDHCQKAIQYIGQHYKEFRKTAIYLITLDSVEKITQFMNKYGVGLKSKKNVTLLQDTKYEFMNKFKPGKYPSLFLYSARGELILYEDNEQNLFMVTQKINAPVK